MDTQHIYALIDPREDGINAVRYIGITKNVYIRLIQHTGNEWRNERKEAWMAELKQFGLVPNMELLEVIEASPDAQRVAMEREEYWIREYLRMGAPLLNIHGVTKRHPKRTKLHTQPTPQLSMMKRPPDLMMDNENLVMTEFERLRIRAGLTIAQVSSEAQIYRSTIEKIEKDIPVRAPLASRACNVLSRYLGYEITNESIDIKTV